MKSIFNTLVKIILVTLIIISFTYIIIYYYDLYNTKKQSSLLYEFSLSGSRNIQSKIENITNNIDSKDVVEIKTTRMLQIEELKELNSDIIGWIEIEDTDINFPVLQCSDNSFYINHDYKKHLSKNGAIFLDKDYVWNPPSSNLLIYGHNMRNNTMFQSLLKYKNKDYYEEHPVIRFTTIDEDAVYEIFSVFESRVYYESEKGVFRYYYFINADNEDEYYDYVRSAKNASLYDTDITAKYGDQLLTLSTCSYHVKDGRFVVVARKI